MDVVGGSDNYFILEWYMNKKTRRNERKAAQLKHTKKKLKRLTKENGNGKTLKAYKKKKSLVKSLKNLKKRIIRKNGAST